MAVLREPATLAIFENQQVKKAQKRRKERRRRLAGQVASMCAEIETWGGER